MKNKSILIVLAFIVGCLIAFYAGIFKDINSEERYLYRFELRDTEQYQQSVDIAEQGWLKYYLQPGSISLVGRFKIGDFEEPVYAEFCGVQGYVSQGSKKGAWQKLSKEDAVKVRVKGYTTLNIEVKLPKEHLYNYEVATAVLKINDNTGKQTVINFGFINSKYK